MYFNLNITLVARGAVQRFPASSGNHRLIAHSMVIYGRSFSNEHFKKKKKRNLAITPSRKVKKPTPPLPPVFP